MAEAELLSASCAFVCGGSHLSEVNTDAHHLIITIQWHVGHLHTCTARIRGGTKYETRQRSIFGILIISV